MMNRDDIALRILLWAGVVVYVRVIHIWCQSTLAYM
jgi:hypothetical protein